MTAPPTPTPRRFIDVPAVLTMLDVDRRTLLHLIEHEGLPCVRLTERLRRFDVDALDAWIDSRWSTRAPDEADAA